MERYRLPAALRGRRGPRALILVEPDADVGRAVEAARMMLPGAVLVVSTSTTEQWAGALDDPRVEAAVLGAADLDELAASWRVSHLMTVSASGVACARPAGAGPT